MRYRRHLSCHQAEGNREPDNRLEITILPRPWETDRYLNWKMVTSPHFPQLFVFEKVE